MTPRVEVWEESVGFLPWKVTVYEEPSRKGVLYLRWRQDGNWKKKSLKRPLRTARGKIDLDTKRWALTEAQVQYARLVAGVPAEEITPVAPLSIEQGLAAVIDSKTGKYPTDTMHRREVVRELERAIKQWGAQTPWETIKRKDLRKLWRHRINELRAEKQAGLRGAEITIQRVLAVAAWLRDEELIPAGACVASRKWKEELRTDWIELSGERALPDVQRPRHSLEEMRKIMAVAGQVDPRLELALSLGAELRLGQVIRCRRSDLNLEHKTFTVRGKGHKRGETVMLTDGQMRVVQHHLTAGYLRDLERAAADYPLFPAGQLRGGRSMKDPRATLRYQLSAKPIDRSVLDGWFHDAEAKADVPTVKGRAAYGLRRQSVDAAKAANISREGLQRLGGWVDTQVPDAIYAEQEAGYAREEARDVRAKLRGEEDVPE
jgi:integrase